MITSFRQLRRQTLDLWSVHIEEIFDAWVHAAQDAREALCAWAGTGPAERATAHAVYRAALDREERAADVLRIALVALV